MKRNLKLLVILFSMSIASHAYCEQPQLTRSSITDQLQQPTVSAVHRDGEGILWVGTQQGLHRFDGATLSVFNSDETNQNWIPESEIKDIAEDDTGNLFAATSGGALLSWDRSSQTFSSINETGSVEMSRLVRMLVSNSGYVWLLNQVGLQLYDSKTRYTENWVADLKLLEYVGTPRAIAEDKTGNIWVGGSLGLVNIVIKEKTILRLGIDTLGLPHNSSITVLEVNQEGNLIIGTNAGHLILWDIVTNTVLAKSTLGDNGQVYISRIILFEDKLVIGTDRGLYMSDHQFSFFDEVVGQEVGVAVTDVYSLHRDADYVWVGKIDGLDILSFSPCEFFNLENRGVSSHVLAFAEDENDGVWIGTYSGLYLYQDQTRSHVKIDLNATPGVQDDQRIVTLAINANDLWLGLFEGGVKKLDTSSIDSRSIKQIEAKDLAVTKILTSDDSDEVWVATFDHGLFRIASAITHSYFENGYLPERSVNLLFRSTTEMLLAASGSRVYRHDPQSGRFIEMALDFGLGDIKPFVYSFAQAITGDILIGTKDHGIFIWPRTSQIRDQFELHLATTESSLAKSTVYAIEIDSAGNLWCSTQHGVVKLDPKGQLIKRFTTADGLQGNDFTLGASFKSRQGLIYFGGTNGYNRFDPNEIEIDTSPSPMRLTGISLPGQDEKDLGPVADLTSLQLTHKDHFVTFQFSVLDFIDPERNQFRYKLENFDKEWIENGTSNTATFTNLPAGRYVFRAQGANSAGIWNRDGIALDVTVLPAPWYTWWAFTLYSLAGLCIFWGMHRIYRSYAIDRRSAQMALEMFEAEIRADDDMQEQLELQDELVHSAYQHNLTTLSLISDCISLRSSNQTEDVKRSLTESSIRRIAALASLEDCLSYQAGGPVANLHKYTEGIIPGLLKRSPVTSETIVTINEVTTLPIPAELASPISIAIYELLDNCIQHAFEYSSPANYIHIKLVPGSTHEPSARCFELSVHDNGVGIPHNIENLTREGCGIAIVQAIALKLGGTLQFSQASGTTIWMTIPNVDNPESLGPSVNSI